MDLVRGVCDRGVVLSHLIFLPERVFSFDSVDKFALGARGRRKQSTGSNILNYDSDRFGMVSGESSNDQLTPGGLDVLTEFMVPLIEETVDEALEAYHLNPNYNDNYIVGSYCWKNLYNRVVDNARIYDDVRCEFPKPNDLQLVVKGGRFRIHRVPGDTLVPKGGNAVKKATKECWCELPGIDRPSFEVPILFIGYVVDIDNGLESVFVGHLEYSDVNADKCFCVPVATLYKREFEHSGLKISSDQFVPDEKEAFPEQSRKPTLVVKKSDE